MAIQKYTKHLTPATLYPDDFAEETLIPGAQAMGASFIGLAGLTGTVAATALAGPLGGLIVAFAVTNDIMCLLKRDREKVLDVKSESVSMGFEAPPAPVINLDIPKAPSAYLSQPDEHQVQPLRQVNRSMGFTTANSPPTEQTALDLITASPYKSRLFFGGQRTGKSFLAANCALRAKSKGADCFYINMAAWGTEDDAYSAVALKSASFNLQAMDAHQALEAVDAAVEVLQAFYQHPKPAILLFEEWCETGSRNHKHRAILDVLTTEAASIVEQLANTGQKRQKAIYATAPMFVAGSLAQTAKAAKSMSLVLVAIAPGHKAMWQGQTLTFDRPVFSQALANWHGVTEPTGKYTSERIASVDGHWVAVGTLEPMPAIKAAVAPVNIRQTLEDSYAAPGPLAADEQAVIEVARSNAGVIKARDVMRAEKATLRGYGAEEIRDVFIALADKGYGSLVGEGNRLGFEIT